MTVQDTALSRPLVVGHKRDGRSCYDKEAKRELIEASLGPGVSVAYMALQHGINANLLRPGSAATNTKLMSGRLPAARPR